MYVNTGNTAVSIGIHRFLAVCFAISGFWILHCSSLYGQVGYVKHFTTSDGLPHNLCFHVNQDVNGTIWVTTDDGFARYDGDVFTRFGKKEGFSSPFPIMAVNRSDGKQVVAMWKGISCVFDGQRAEPISYLLNSELSLLNNIALQSDSFLLIQKYLYATCSIARNKPPYTFKSLRLNKGEDGKLYLDQEKREIEYPFRSGESPHYFLDKGRVLVFSFTKGMYQWGKDSVLFPIWQEHVGDKQITAMAADPDGDLWLSALGEVFHFRDDQFLGSFKIPHTKEIKRMLAFESGKLIFSTYSGTRASSGGLFYYDVEKKNLVNLHVAIGLNSASTERNCA